MRRGICVVWPNQEPREFTRLTQEIRIVFV